MDLKVNIEPKDINEYVAQQVINSTIGNTIKKHIQQHVKKIENDEYYNKIIKEEIFKIVRDTLCNEYYKEIKAKVKKALEDKLTEEFVYNMINAGLEAVNIKGRGY